MKGTNNPKNVVGNLTDTFRHSQSSFLIIKKINVYEYSKDGATYLYIPIYVLSILRYFSFPHGIFFFFDIFYCDPY